MRIEREKHAKTHRPMATSTLSMPRRDNAATLYRAKKLDPKTLRIGLTCHGAERGSLLHERAVDEPDAGVERVYPGEALAALAQLDAHQDDEVDDWPGEDERHEDEQPHGGVEGREQPRPVGRLGRPLHHDHPVDVAQAERVAHALLLLPDERQEVGRHVRLLRQHQSLSHRPPSHSLPQVLRPFPQKPIVWSGWGSIHTPSASPGHNRSRLPLTARSVNKRGNLSRTSPAYRLHVPGPRRGSCSYPDPPPTVFTPTEPTMKASTWAIIRQADHVKTQNRDMKISHFERHVSSHRRFVGCTQLSRRSHNGEDIWDTCVSVGRASSPRQLDRRLLPPKTSPGNNFPPLHNGIDWQQSPSMAAVTARKRLTFIVNCFPSEVFSVPSLHERRVSLLQPRVLPALQRGVNPDQFELPLCPTSTSGCPLTRWRDFYVIQADRGRSCRHETSRVAKLDHYHQCRATSRYVATQEVWIVRPGLREEINTTYERALYVHEEFFERIEALRDFSGRSSLGARAPNKGATGAQWLDNPIVRPQLLRGGLFVEPDEASSARLRSARLKGGTFFENRNFNCAMHRAPSISRIDVAHPEQSCVVVADDVLVGRDHFVREAKLGAQDLHELEDNSLAHILAVLRHHVAQRVILQATPHRLGLNVSSTTRSLETVQVAQGRGIGEGMRRNQPCPGVISENQGKPKSGWQDRESNPGPPECESTAPPRSDAVVEETEAIPGKHMNRRQRPPRNQWCLVRPSKQSNACPDSFLTMRSQWFPGRRRVGRVGRPHGEGRGLMAASTCVRSYDGSAFLTELKRTGEKMNENRSPASGDCGLGSAGHRTWLAVAEAACYTRGHLRQCKLHREEELWKDREGIGKESAMAFIWGPIPAFAWSDFRQPWKVEVRMAGPRIEPSPPPPPPECESSELPTAPPRSKPRIDYTTSTPLKLASQDNILYVMSPDVGVFFVTEYRGKLSYRNGSDLQVDVFEHRGFWRMHPGSTTSSSENRNHILHLRKLSPPALHAYSFQTAPLPPRRTGFNPQSVTPYFRKWVSVPDDAAGWRVFSGISRFRALVFRAAPFSSYFTLIGADLPGKIWPRGEPATHIKSLIAAKCKTLDWRAVFSSCCVYLWDFQRRPYYFIGGNVLNFGGVLAKVVRAHAHHQQRYQRLHLRSFFSLDLSGETKSRSLSCLNFHQLKPNVSGRRKMCETRIQKVAGSVPPSSLETSTKVLGNRNRTCLGVGRCVRLAFRKSRVQFRLLHWKPQQKCLEIETERVWA
ncbi:hypothetical protein PR048_019340 [Dryococelus australis]|uniref:Uncharacterized protein n=1 Tax=Dryococelus australis TaxID=614101 RepID=A0ABQ9H3B6_9NEOP|nr:hypothetical protein PR048_019340 [Dryococelus australis]